MAGSLGRRCLRLWRSPCEGPILLFPCPFVLLLTLAALEDWRTGYLSDGWSLLLAVTGFMTAFRRQGAGDSLLSAALVFTIYVVLYLVSQKSMGTGDLVLSTGAAFWFSPLTALLFIWFSALSALLFLAIPLLLGRKKQGIRCDSVLLLPWEG